MGQNEIVESRNEIVLPPEALESFSGLLDSMIENDTRKYEIKAKAFVLALDQVTKQETERLKSIVKSNDNYYKSVENALKEYRMNLARMEQQIANSTDEKARDAYIKMYESQQDVLNKSLLIIQKGEETTIERINQGAKAVLNRIFRKNK